MSLRSTTDPPDGRRLLCRLAAVRLEARLAPEERRGLLQVLLPEQRLHEDIEGLVLNGELVYVRAVGAWVVTPPPRGGEQGVSGAPFIGVAPHGQIPLPVKILVA